MHKTRRDFLIGIGGAAFATGLATLPRLTAQAQTERPFRFVLLSDIHLRKDLRSPEGMVACLDAVERLSPKPNFIVTGGDLCQNLRGMELKEATEIADLFVSIWNKHTRLPTYHCLGNHDPAGWNSDTFPRNYPQFGMKLLMNKLGMKSLSYSFDHNGWHFVILDNVHLPEPGEFVGEFTEKQLTFLRQDLSQHVKQPTMIFCHVPPVTATEFLGGRATVKEGEWRLGTGRMTSNPLALVETMQVGNVRAVLSGHIHDLDRIEVAGYTFICSGSVSGQQWDGPLRNTEEGFGIIDCQPNGMFTYQYYDYGWQASV